MMYENARIEIFRDRVEVEQNALLPPFDCDGEPVYPYFSIWSFKNYNISGADISNFAESIKQEIIRRFEAIRALEEGSGDLDCETLRVKNEHKSKEVEN
jgi:hypothetical protein